MQRLHKVISLWLYEWADDWKRMDVNLCSALFHWVDINSHIIHSLDSYSNFSYPHGWKHCTKNKNIVVSSWTFSPESWGGYPGIMIAIRRRYQVTWVSTYKAKNGVAHSRIPTLDMALSGSAFPCWLMRGMETKHICHWRWKGHCWLLRKSHAGTQVTFQTESRCANKM